MNENNDVYTRVTKQIIEAIEAGATSWRMPWHVSGEEKFSPLNAVSKRPYRGVNCLSLWAIAHKRGFESGFWGTYKQWSELGAQVKRQEKASLVVLWKVSEFEKPGEESEDNRKAFLIRGYSVFNADQVEGFTPPSIPKLSQESRVVEAEHFMRSLGADVRHGGNMAYYDPDLDRVQLPDFERFHNAMSYYSTLSHELTHWTGADTRLARDLSKRFGSHAYAAEELVAELGAAFLLAHLKLANTPREEHARYVNGWLQLLKSDKRAIFTAASKAQAAVDWMEVQAAKQSESAAA